MRSLYCKICRKVTVHRSNGYQRFPRYVLRLWSCEHCAATQSERV